MTRKRTTEPRARLRALAAVAALLALISGCARVDVDSLLGQATAAAAAGKWREALELAEQCASSDPENLTAVILHGRCLLALRRLDEARDVLEAAAKAAPDDFLSQFYFGWVLCECGRYGDALGPLKKAHSLSDGHPEVLPDVLILLSRCCLEQNLDEGITHLLALRRYRAFNRQPEVYNSLGILYRNKGEHENARQSFLMAHEKDEHNPVVLQNLAVLHDQYLDNPKEAMRYYRYALKASQLADDGERQARVQNRLRQMARARLRPEAAKAEKEEPPPPAAVGD